MTINKRSAVVFAVLALGAVPVAVVASSASTDDPAVENTPDSNQVAPANDKEAHVPIWFTL